MLAAKCALFATNSMRNQCRKLTLLSNNARMLRLGGAKDGVFYKGAMQIRNEGHGGVPGENLPFGKSVGKPIRMAIGFMVFMHILGWWSPYILFYGMMNK